MAIPRPSEAIGDSAFYFDPCHAAGYFRSGVVRWCNGSTRVFGALCHGSNPCRTAIFPEIKFLPLFRRHPNHGSIRLMRIKIFTTGGTIDKVYFDARSEFEVGSPQVRSEEHTSELQSRRDL